MRPVVLLLISTALVTGAGAGDAPPLPRDELPVDLFDAERPYGLPEPAAAADTGADPAMERRRFDLGRRLFFDPILSGDRAVACASCHDPAHGFSVADPLPRGVAGRRALRHPPTLFNRVYGESHSWDGRVATLEEQVVSPIENENEMGLPLGAAIERLHRNEDYRRAFESAFEDGVNRRNLATALTAFVRRLHYGDSPVDRFHAGDFSRLSDAERHGLWVFESKGGCWQCHTGANFTDEAFHNTGVGAVDGEPEPGRGAITGLPDDRGRFKTPTLRALTLTAPYMHDGSLAALEDVVDFYDRGGNTNAGLDPKVRPLELDAREKRDLVAFLKALSRRGE